MEQKPRYPGAHTITPEPYPGAQYHLTPIKVDKFHPSLYCAQLQQYESPTGGSAAPPAAFVVKYTHREHAEFGRPPTPLGNEVMNRKDVADTMIDLFNGIPPLYVTTDLIKLNDDLPGKCWDFNKLHRTRRAVLDLICSFCAAYAKRSGLIRKIGLWASGTELDRLTNYVANEGALATFGILRSTLIAFGRDIIKQTRIAYDFRDEEGKHDREAYHEKIQRGVWYLERAGGKTHDMLVENNWQELMEESDPPVMKMLFGFPYNT
ncbi:hypothetical protein B0H63DRAFT_527167 [Podospora didyma]|uniref:Uncharacterized protein n=1 Tax=Podospora didyma TaxID=330526 RepID=A0AAE0N6Q9_9PEZI|nr:hypothetical protein B0H63DRAFT_527167 [Podospora didyma]